MLLARSAGSTLTFIETVAGQSGSIVANTSDAADSASLCIGGGGTCADTRGGYFAAYGNENGGQTGSVQIIAGNVASANIQFRGAGAGKGTIDGSTGNMAMVGTITSSRTTDLGWAVVNAANQACNTTCTSACVVGIDTGSTTSAFLACSDATADSCLCAGAS